MMQGEDVLEIFGNNVLLSRDKEIINVLLLESQVYIAFWKHSKLFEFRVITLRCLTKTPGENKIVSLITQQLS